MKLSVWIAAIAVAGIVALPGICSAQTATVEKAPADTGAVGYRIERPGTITFTVGMKIKGKVAKPQVMIFLPKERSYFRPVITQRSFHEDMQRRPPFIPLVE